MQDIKELALFFAGNRQLFSGGGLPNFEKGSKLSSFFQGLIQGKIQTDEEALMLLFNTTEETSTYRKLKSTLRDKLLEGLLQLEMSPEHFTDYQRAYYACHRQWLFVKILTGQNVNVAAMSLAKRLLKQTMKYDFVQLSMDVTSYLRIQYALRESDMNRFEEMNKLFAHFRSMYDAECLAEEIYTTLVAKYINTRASKEKSAEAIAQHFEHLQPLADSYDSYRLHLYVRLVELMQYTVVYQFEKALEVCDNAIRFFKSKAYEARVPVHIFLYEKLICHIQLRQLEEGRKTANECLGYLKQGTFNWFKYQELVLKLSMHTRRYQEAYEVFESVSKHPRYEFLPDNVKEAWRIYEAYIYLLIQLKKVRPGEGYVFKSGKFINEVPIYSRDKAGMNIAIQVIRFILLITERKHAQLYDETDSFNQYCYRYVNTSRTKRSFNFMKVLLHIPAGQFDAYEVERKGKRYLQQLESLPVQIADQLDEIEIIPYEHLWELLREVL